MTGETFIGDALLGTAARSLLGHCSGGDTLLGSTPVWASVIILLVIGFVVGVATGCFLTTHRQHKLLRSNAQPVGPAPQDHAVLIHWTPAVLRSKRRGTSRAAQVVSAAGPLSAGLQGGPTPLHAIVPVDNPAFRSSAEEGSPLAWAVNPEAERDFVAAARAADMQLDAALEPQHSLRRQGSTIKAFPGDDCSDAGNYAVQVDGAAAEAHSARQAQKAKDAKAIQTSYNVDDLDDEWQELLDMIDARMLMLNKPSIDAQERAVAIKSLIVSTARESPEQALLKAVEDVERYRRVHNRT